ncbi:MAG: Xaa-Pro peptidase family protein [Desulfobacteraceae bacterium]|jgi:Xaa-Pro aminopeptidase|nr:Xaa-Pro peptidase family protein [Desulfobacteraceae bacterium]
MQAPTVPRSEIARRIGALQAQLARKGLDAALILQTADLFYFAGTIQKSHLWVPLQGEPLLLVRKDLARARSESPLDRIAAIGSPKEIPGLLTANGLAAPQNLGLELDVLPANLYLSYGRIFQGAGLSDISTEIRLLRAVKSDWEIGMIRQAARLADQLAAAVPDLLREGMSEIELAGRVEARARALGHQGIVRMRMWGSELFYGHLMAGPSGAVPSFLASPTGGPGVGPAVAQGPGMRPIQRHEPILVDYVFVFNGYLADHTRIFSLGRLPADLERAHAAMLVLQTEVTAAARPGIPSGRLYQVARESAARQGYGAFFMGADERRVRFVGHGIGLELDEFPFLAQGQELPLQSGMVFALEPKLVFPGRGVVGIENTHLVTPEGVEQLTRLDEQIMVV